VSALAQHAQVSCQDCSRRRHALTLEQCGEACRGLSDSEKAHLRSRLLALVDQEDTQVQHFVCVNSAFTEVQALHGQENEH